MSVNKTIIEGLNSKYLDAYVQSIQNPMTYQYYFPLKQNPFFSWKTMFNQLEQPNVAADIQAQNGTTARKRRPIMDVASGDLPLMTISREMKRSDIKEYQNMLALSGGNSMAADLVQYWGADVNFCYTGIQSQYEYISWALLSGAGKLGFTATNNANFANEFDLDYDVDSTQKIQNTTAWSNASGATPIADLQLAVTTAKAKGIILRHAWLNLDNFYLLQATDEMKELTRIYINGSAAVQTTPSIEEINKAIQKIAHLSGLTIHVVDSLVTRELKDGTRTAANPFADNTIVFSETEKLGTSQYSVLNQNDSAVTYARRENALIRKFSTQEPYGEVTIGESDGLPVLDSAYRNIYMKTNNTSW